ncbi:hypothetical protein CJD36_002965 [Flavipsychrobacter stenotrophus]|uniref:histidine kinase n=1 Tax=Flavipsychrobacter stenotrophus TaxID=2077091 RepID=A0A2S7T0I6_9BACT|nr:ATP-binding protein [Flavipsychrobacter stenotrophus]PQJ12723.1 hypothetical protein CJD36_002965 [Flavipsychrobacter stenotrophus]
MIRDTPCRRLSVYFFAFFLIQLVVFTSCNFSKKVADNSRYFDSVLNAANSRYDVKHIDLICSFVDSAWDAFPNRGPHDMFKKYQWRSSIYSGLFNYAAALRNIDSAIGFINSDPERYKYDYAEAMFVKGNLLLNLNEYDKSFRQLYKGKQFVEQYLDTCAYARYNSCLASVSFIQNKPREAIKYLQEAFDQAGKCKETDFKWAFGERQGELDNIGVCYEILGIYDTAIIYYNKALRFIDSNEHRFPKEKDDIRVCRAVIKGNLGGVYVKNGNLKEAEALLKENIAENDRHESNSQDARLTLMKLSRLYMKQGRFNEAFKIVTDVRRQMDTIQTTDEITWLKLAADYYDTTNDVVHAYPLFKKFISLRDSGEATRKELPGADFNKTFDHLDQAVEIASLKKEKTYANRVLFVSVVLSVMAIIIIYLVWNNYRQSKQNLERQKTLNKQISTYNVTMQKTLNALEQSQQNNTRMMRVVAHDLHNPVSAMVSLIDLLRDGDYDEEQQEMFQMLATSGTNALKLIGDILHAKPAMDMERLELSELLTYSVGLMQYRANEKNQSLILHVVPVTVMADREKIWRVINNLIVNAIKFSYEGKSIEVTLQKKGDVALLSVKDEGVGMSPILSGEIFQHFALGGRAGTSGEESFGLGLSISKQIIDAHGGKIWFESAVGKGTTFYVELKLVGDEI